MIYQQNKDKDKNKKKKSNNNKNLKVISRWAKIVILKQ